MKSSAIVALHDAIYANPLTSGESYHLEYNDAGSVIEKRREQNDVAPVDSLPQPNIHIVTPLEEMLWDEEQKLRAVRNGDGTHVYLYDHRGERLAKASVLGVDATIDGEANAGVSNSALTEYQVYVNPYLVVTLYENWMDYTKHFYMGSIRVAREVGGAPCLPSEAPNDLGTDFLGNPYQYFFYGAFGDILAEQNVNWGTFQSAYQFNGKELDKETGWNYYGARYYASDWGVWLSVDRLASKYPAWSPYNFVMNNPINLIDPNGDSVTVNGDQSRMFVKELNKRVGSELKIDRDKKSGRLSYELKGDGKSISQVAQLVMDAIDDDKIMVNIDASESGIMSNGKVVPGGAFLGTTLSTDGISVETSQKVVPFLLKSFDKVAGAQRGQSHLHELIESYKAGQLSLQQGINAKPGGSIYSQAHDFAPPQGFNPSSIGATRDPETGWIHFYYNSSTYVQTLRK
ncbi:hypothetical protein GC167_06320 [bacterium]|nr:hypothetical protein [bacterium]